MPAFPKPEFEFEYQVSEEVAALRKYKETEPGRATKNRFTKNLGVFDFDGAIFNKLWQTKTPKLFLSYLRYYISDHRPMWAEFII